MATIKSEWLIPLVLTILSFAMSGWAAYSHNDKDLTSRITAVEVQQKNDGASINRVETKMDKLYEYLTGVKP